jgi:hypothetical protein
LPVAKRPGVSMMLIEYDLPSLLCTTRGVYTVSFTAEATESEKRKHQVEYV